MHVPQEVATLLVLALDIRWGVRVAGYLAALSVSMAFAWIHLAVGLLGLVSWLVEHCIAEPFERQRHSGLGDWSGSRFQKYLQRHIAPQYLRPVALLVLL